MPVDTLSATKCYPSTLHNCHSYAFPCQNIVLFLPVRYPELLLDSVLEIHMISTGFPKKNKRTRNSLFFGVMTCFAVFEQSFGRSSVFFFTFNQLRSQQRQEGRCQHQWWSKQPQQVQHLQLLAFVRSSRMYILLQHLTDASRKSLAVRRANGLRSSSCIFVSTCCCSIAASNHFAFADLWSIQIPIHISYQDVVFLFHFSETSKGK